MIQKSDQKLRELVDNLKKDETEKTKEENNRTKNYHLESGRFYKEVTVNNEKVRLYVLPDSERKAIAIKYHDQMMHFLMRRYA